MTRAARWFLGLGAAGLLVLALGAAGLSLPGCADTGPGEGALGCRILGTLFFVGLSVSGVSLLSVSVGAVLFLLDWARRVGER